MNFDEQSFSSPVCSAPIEWFSACSDAHDYETGWYFLCGASNDTDALAAILGLRDGEHLGLRPATVFGFKARKWGRQPVLVRESGEKDSPNGDAAVSGAALRIERTVHAKMLRGLLPSMFRVDKCYIRLDRDRGEDDELIRGFAFVWDGKTEELKN
ncbi:hypothetical protein CIHG_08012 [Coccidioides immitis H538.4]|uniref:Uncharacterized protein n=2 Tax=Coccidioides immitis TaxID=5501 RepID=A0A0J8RZI1_COCIT|nr:hypothetical protein CIRG_08982 [Coccidioides immitis RMSCC 2394]KMU90202.1 hypothetical protein CIHG_08012 [Coccidioides immitis H538.4]TPX25098.1 hypothetical protein DIZ76_010547 [Coccidioides immitis]